MFLCPKKHRKTGFVSLQKVTVVEKVSFLTFWFPYLDMYSKYLSSFLKECNFYLSPPFTQKNLSCSCLQDTTSFKTIQINR